MLTALECKIAAAGCHNMHLDKYASPCVYLIHAPVPLHLKIKLLFVQPILVETVSAIQDSGWSGGGGRGATYVAGFTVQRCPATPL